MAKKSARKETIQRNASPVPRFFDEGRTKSAFHGVFSAIWRPLLLAVVTLAVYRPSLNSDFVYDARYEMLSEGFITNPAHLPDVLSLKVLGMNLMLGPRPGALLYLMLNAAFWGVNPVGYHLSSNLLHAANVGLLYVLLMRLSKAEAKRLAGVDGWKVRLSAGVAALLFAVHPITTEPVAAVSYSSDLLVTFFTLLALLAATAFRPESPRSAMIAGTAGALCAFAAVTCKESGAAAAPLLMIYWILFRRREAKLPWGLFLGGATLLTGIFLAARFMMAPPPPFPNALGYLGGSFSHVITIQPRLWVFMMGKLVWPVHLSADYTLENVSGVSLPVALVILVVIGGVQIWLAAKSRLGAFGVAVYWLGLATVSNFVPLYRILGDRFYYLPLVGVVMQIMALLLMTAGSSRAFPLAVAPLAVAILPLIGLTLARQTVFTSDFSLWTDTVRVSPFSSLANNNLGLALSQRGRMDDAMALYQRALEIKPDYDVAHFNLGIALAQKGRFDDAIAQYQRAVEINPGYADAHNNLGNALIGKGKVDEAFVHFQKAVALDPWSAEAACNLGNVSLAKGQLDEAIANYQRALEINPNFTQVHFNLGIALFKKGRFDEAGAQFQEFLRVNPDDINARENLAKAEALAAQGAGRR